MKKRTKITAAALLGTAAAALGGVYYGYWEAFKADPKRTDDIMAMPGSELYAPYRETTAQNINRLLAEWTAPDCADSTKKTPGRKILSFKRSGAA